MPLTGLDEIEWDKLSHAYGSAADIPDLLRNLDEAETNEEFNKLYREIVVRVNHQGDIYDSTAPTTSFLLQLLGDTENDDKQLRILGHLGSLLRDIQSYPIGFFRSPTEFSVTLIRSNIATYDAVAKGLAHYIAGLGDENEEIRLASLSILFALIEEYKQILPALVICVSEIKDAWFQACAVWTFVNIETYSWHRDRRMSSIEQLNQWLKHDNALVRYSAAFGKLRLSLDSTIDEMTIKTIVEALKANVWHSKGDVWGDKLDAYIELTPFFDPLHWITKRSGLSDAWIAILKQLEPTPFQAHIYVAEILKRCFSVKSVEASSMGTANFMVQDATREEIIYHEMIPLRPHQLRINLMGERQVLQAIVDCEPFWEIPTNLFSFFYGLPDDREELRKLAEGK